MFTLDNADVYDIEVFPNAFTFHMEKMFNDISSTWEISHFRDDRASLIQYFTYCNQYGIPMIGFNNLHYDYVIIHFIFNNPGCTVEDIYAKSQQIIQSQNNFGNMIWANDRFAPQIDLFKIHHFDNKAKTTGLKALQINMRSENVVESAIPFGSFLTSVQIDQDIIPYNKHDVKETKRFAHYSLKAMQFRIGLIDQFGVDVMNYNDTKIGSKILENRLGEHVCYERVGNRKQPRQTPRWRIALNDIIFPYICFENSEFARVLDYMRSQVLTPDDIDDPDAVIKTKGVFSNLKAHVGGIDFHFGTGGIHGSVTAQKIQADENYLIRDIDVEGLYPNIAIVNKLSPEHLGEAFIQEYSKIPIERKKHAKGTVENASFKLAANGTYGNSNNKFSVFYDPQFTMTITINGQLMLCMLVEWLLVVPTLKLVQVNTDGITYMIHKDYEPQAVEICNRWQQYTLLKLEDANYSRMWIRDVNNYVAETTSGKLKQKGAYWYPDPLDYANSISEASPPAWHKDLSALVIVRAAVAAMVYGIDPETFIRAHSDPFDFMLRVKVDRSSRLMLGDQQIQNTSRYYVAVEGVSLVKISPPPPGCTIGDYKRRNGITEAEYQTVLRSIPAGSWDERIHTKNKSKYLNRELSIQAGWKCAECNNASKFSFHNVNYDYYIAEAKKLIIG